MELCMLAGWQLIWLFQFQLDCLHIEFIKPYVIQI